MNRTSPTRAPDATAAARIQKLLVRANKSRARRNEDAACWLYQLAFRMTGDPVLAHALTLPLVSGGLDPDVEVDDLVIALLEQLRDFMPLAGLNFSPLFLTVPAGSLRLPAPREIQGALLQLEPVERLLYLLRAVEGFSFERIARILGMAEDVCEAGVHHAGLRLRELLARTRAE